MNIYFVQLWMKQMTSLTGDAWKDVRYDKEIYYADSSNKNIKKCWKIKI